jgi:hypothetical protein
VAHFGGPPSTPKQVGSNRSNCGRVVRAGRNLQLAEDDVHSRFDWRTARGRARLRGRLRRSGTWLARCSIQRLSQTNKVKNLMEAGPALRSESHARSDRHPGAPLSVTNLHLSGWKAITIGKRMRGGRKPNGRVGKPRRGKGQESIGSGVE